MRALVTWGLLLLAAVAPRGAGGQQATPPRDTAATAVTAGEADADPPKRRLVRWNEFDGKYVTLRLGGNLLVDYGAFAQDDASKEQFALEPGFKIRDVRFVLSGRFKTRRPITWQFGYMYDGANDEWYVRQTGIMIAVPELWGHLFVGRSKAGISLNRVMVGYNGWTIERFPFSESIPLLADGVKWLGYLPNRKLLWNVGLFTDWLSEGQSFSYFDRQLAARVAWVPMVSDSSGTLLHIGFDASTGKANDGQLQVRARPEATTAPYFLDTGKFPARSAQSYGVEAYYRPGSWLFGTEYFVETTNAPERGNPTLHGGDVSAIWLLTGETRSYNTVGGYFRGVSPRRTVFEGGPGAWEAVLRLSYTDLDDAGVQGGTFWRLTPTMNWYLSDNLRLILVYGYGKLDRFDTRGATQFFQARLQTVF